MRVLILSLNDWANLGYELSRCLNSQSGYEAKSISAFRSLFGYQPASIKFPEEISEAECKMLIHDWADVIVSKEGYWGKHPFDASIIEKVSVGSFLQERLPKEKTIPFHVGSMFRAGGQEMLEYEVEHYPAIIISPDLAFHPLARHPKVNYARPCIDVDRWYALSYSI